MAVIGKRGSYGTIAPIQGNPLGDAMQDIEDNAFKYRAEKRLEDEAKKKAEEEKNKEIEASIKAVKAETTPYETRNAMVIDFANKLRDGVYQKAMDYKNGKLSKTEYDIFNANAQAQIATLNESSKRLTQKNADMTKLVQEGKLARGFEEDAISLGGAVDKNQISWRMRPDGVMEAIVYEKDPNTGEIKILDKGGLEKIGEVAYTPVMNVDFDVELEQFKKTNPMDVIETLNPMTKQKVTQLTQRLKENISNYVDAKLTDKNALSVAYYEATGERERNISDDKKIEIAKQYLKDKYEKSYQKEIGVDEATQRANFGLAKRKAEEDEEKPDFNIVETPPSYAQARVKPGKGYKTVSITMKNQKPVSMISAFDFDDKGNQVRKEYSLATLNSYTVEVNKKGKRGIVAEITYPDIKTSSLTPSESSIFSKFKTNPDALTEEEQLVVSKITKGAQYKTEVVRLTEKDAVKFKNTVGAKNAQEMANLARVEEEKEEKSKGSYDDL
jgi:hypothetical protein